MPEYGKALSQDKQCIPLTVVFDGIKEPRELGSLFHAASVVGCEQIVTTKGITVIVPILGLLYKVSYISFIVSPRKEAPLIISGNVSAINNCCHLL